MIMKHIKYKAIFTHTCSHTCLHTRAHTCTNTM